MNNGQMMEWGGMFAGPWIMALLFLGFVVLVVLLVRSLSSRDCSVSALELLEQRFANGEINTEEFEQARETLRN